MLKKARYAGDCSAYVFFCPAHKVYLFAKNRIFFRWESTKAERTAPGKNRIFPQKQVAAKTHFNRSKFRSVAMRSSE